jgi:hypothetical protein
MPLRSNTKTKETMNEMEKNIAPIFVMNNSALKPYMELFEYHPENIYQQPLGSLIGFFEIKEYSEDSAYIVNFLTSVLKKEYYINPKRSVTDSLDSALHKVNVALSEIVKNGNTNWLNKLDGSVCVLEKNAIHFSVAGNAKILLHRKQILTDISEGLANDELDPHPLKTFVNVSSGRIEKDDKLLILSDDVFNILNDVQLRKNIQRFENENFIQFLRTALGNELEMTAAIIIDVAKPKEVENRKVTPVISPIEAEQSDDEFNAFSGKTYEKPSLKKPSAIEKQPEAIAPKEYTDKKTRHIYIQGNHDNHQETSQFQLFMETAKENLSDVMFTLRESSRKKANVAKKSISKSLAKLNEEYQKRRLEAQEKAEQVRQEKRLQAEFKAQEDARITEERAQQAEIRRQEEILLAEERRQQEEIKLREESARQAELAKEQEVERQKQIKIQEEIKKSAEALKKTEGGQPRKTTIEVHKEEETYDFEQLRKNSSKPLTLQQKIELARLEMDSKFDRVMSSQNNQSASLSQRPEIKNKQDYKSITLEKLGKLELKEKVSETYSKVMQTIAESRPDFSKIRDLFDKFSSKQKFAITAIILAIIIVPYLINKLTEDKPQQAVVTTAVPTLADTLSQDKNISLGSQLVPSLAQPNILSVEMFDGTPFFITKDKIIGSLENPNKEFPLPADSGSVVSSTFMKDLNLIFLLTDKQKMLSFSPISQQFKENNIELVPTASNKFMATYLTYLYMFDSSTNQIYRYPRAEGGFGAKSDWLKDQVNFGKIDDIAIDDNIYILSNKQITKLFKGQKQNVNFESSKTPINFDLIYTNADSQFFYAADLENSRLVQFNKDGSISNQYFNEKIKQTTSFSVDEKNKKAYFITPSEVLSLSM